MQIFQQLPIFSDVADWFGYPVLTSGVQDSLIITAPGGTTNGYITLSNDSYFALFGFGCWTNYDNFGGQFATADSTSILAAPNTVPNNFTAAITRSDKTVYSNQPLTQAELCSSGYHSGKQMPLPVIYQGAITFDFVITDMTGLPLLDPDDEQIDLEISLWMLGYKVRKDNWDKFVNYFPGLRAAGY